MVEKNINILKTIPRLFHYSKSTSSKVLPPYPGDDEKVQLNDKTLRELLLQQEAMEKEMNVSQHIHALKELNLVDNEKEPKIVLIANEM